MKAPESSETDFFFFVSFLFLKRLLPFINPFQKRKRNKPPKQSLRKKIKKMEETKIFSVSFWDSPLLIDAEPAPTRAPHEKSKKNP